MGLEEAIDALKSGSPIMVYDDDSREGEVDLVYYAPAVDEDAIYTLRTMAGGLICYTTSSSVTRQLGIPWGDELLSKWPGLERLARKRLSYGDRPAFTIWVNYKGVKTGISDRDRSLTIRMLDKVVELAVEGRAGEAREMFYREFQAPGHIPILAARGLSQRRGHTELTVSLALLAGLRPSLVIAEMLDKGVSLSIGKAELISRETGWPLVYGREVVEVCRGEEVCWGS